MNQSISDLLLNIDPHYPDFEHFQDGIFNMKPIYYKNSYKIHMEVTLDHVLPFEVWDVFLMRLKKVTKCSIDLHIQVRKAGIQLVELHHYINHFVSMNHRLKIFGDALPTMEEKYLIYHIADEVPRNEAIAHKHVLEAYLKQCGIHYEILIRELNIGQGKIASVQVQEHEDKPVQKIEEKKGYAFKKRKNVEQYAKINLSDISEAMQEVVFSGQIFDIELRQLKSGKHLQLLWVKDETDAIIVKRFERGAITLESLNSLKKGMSIRVYGRSEYDEYMREMIFIPEVIEEISTTKRMDTASEKRVELHCHTKLSEMDGVCDIDEFIQKNKGDFYFFTTKARHTHSEITYPDNCYLLFGKETKGLPEELLLKNPDKCVRIPMQGEIRSLTLSNSVAIGVYEVLRQWDYPELQNFGQLHNYKWENT